MGCEVDHDGTKVARDADAERASKTYCTSGRVVAFIQKRIGRAVSAVPCLPMEPASAEQEDKTLSKPSIRVYACCPGGRAEMIASQLRPAPPVLPKGDDRVA